MFIMLLGRQPDISFAELQAVFGATHVTRLTDQSASVTAEVCQIDRLGGVIKYGRVIHRMPARSSDRQALVAASHWIHHHYLTRFHEPGKYSLGVSAYHLRVSPRDVQKTGLLLKQSLKRRGISLRLVPNVDISLSTATVHNNKLGSSPKKRELIILRAKTELLIAEGCGAQNITAYRRRDRDRPRRDAFVGMLPPKLAQIMLNLARGASTTPWQHPAILDPFCGSGTILQEALLCGYQVYGSDISDKMIDDTTTNLTWLTTTHQPPGIIKAIEQADATTHHWPYARQLDAVVCETYLGRPFSAPPQPDTLRHVVSTCNRVISQFLINIKPQLTPGTPLCIAVPAWYGTGEHGAGERITQLPLLHHLADLGYHQHNRQPLIYHREGQVVGRQLLILSPA